MKFTRIVSFVAFASLAIPSVSARENSMGIRVGFNTRNSSPAAGLWFQHEFAPHFRLAPNIDYIFRRNDTDALSINCNGQFPIHFGGSGAFVFYPLAGLNYTSWNYHHNDDPDISDSSSDGNGDVTSRKNRFGFNAGAGLEYRVSPTLKLALEAKGTLVKSYSSATVTLSIGYVF
ncbi:MAG: porin family protein [Muribaculaceae bacterium]|nr:porin family protein [Muribaculaceae bacterium]